MTNERSGFLKLNARDLFRGALIAIASPIMFSVAASLQAGCLPGLADLRLIFGVGLSAGLTYLIKNLVTNSTGTIAATEAPKDAPAA